MTASAINYQKECVKILRYDYEFVLICCYRLVSGRDRVQTLAVWLNSWCSSPLGILLLKIEIARIRGNFIA